MLKEVKLAFTCNIAGYNTNKIEAEDFRRFLEQQAKAYVGAKDIGILGNCALTINSTEE